MRDYVTGMELGTALCEALNIDPSTVSAIALECDVGEVTKVTTVGPARKFDVAQVVKEYTIVKRAGWPPPLAPPKLGDIYYKGGTL